MMLIAEVVSLLLEVMYVAAEKAPSDICESMNPIRGVAPQTGPSPYRFGFMDKTEIFANGSVVFTIKSYYPRKFIGFMVQARDAQDQPIGYFDIYNYKIHVWDCLGYDRNTAVQKWEIVIEDIDMHWFSPFDFKGEVTFYATVVENRTVVWAKHRVTPKVKVI